MCPFPTNATVIEEYVMELRRNQRPVSAIRGFLEAANFCQFFLKMTFVEDHREMVTAKVKRIVEVSDKMKPEKKQARVLTLREVEFLETCLSDERLDRTDPVACGCMLFCLYSRSRWSDLRKIYGFVMDVREVNGHISGYLECRTRSHKTSRQIAKSGLAMPLVAPVWGLLTPPWGLRFVKLCAVAERTLSSLEQEPMLAAPDPDGQWSKRSVTTTEASKWIRNILTKMDGEIEYTTIHSLKATPLSWCAKWGLEPDVRLLLGHQSTGKQSAECYARDNLAKPLRDFDLVLQQIRTRAFSPDATRSGMMSTQVVQDPIWNYAVPESAHEDQAGISLPESNEMSSSSSSESSSTEEEVDSRGLVVDPVSQPRTWDPDTEMYRNKKSLVVHVIAVGGADSFSCGIKVSPDYEKIQETPFLDIRRCRRCAQAKPIKTVGQFASALKKLRTER